MRVEVRPGEGGDHAVRFAERLVTVVRAWARREHADVSVEQATGRNVVLTVVGPAAAVAALAGTHRLQGYSGHAGARHTSTASIAVLDDIPETSPV